MGLNLKGILKAVVGSGDKVLDVAGDLHIPVVSKIDAAKDMIKSSVKKKSISVDAVAEIVSALDTAKMSAVTAIESARALPIGQKGVLESKRALLALANMIAVGLIYWGFPPEQADQVSVLVSTCVAAYILGDSYRPSVK